MQGKICLRDRLVIESDSLHLQQIFTQRVKICYLLKETISLSCSQVKNDLKIKITDTDAGISLQNRDRIFEPYFRSDLLQIGVPEEIGLGLAIVSQLVSFLGGETKLNSELDVGSIFTIPMPIVLVKNEADQKAGDNCCYWLANQK